MRAQPRHKKMRLLQGGVDMTEKQAVKAAIELRDATKVVKISGGLEITVKPHSIGVWSRRGKYIVVVHWSTISAPEIYQ